MSVEIRPLTNEDLDSTIELCRAAGWNQLRQDWARLIDHEPGGCSVAVIDRDVVGTVTTTCYGTQLAWIGMMLVHPGYRRRGIATVLMNTAVDYLRQKNIRCIKLDATPEGKTVYDQLGFKSEWGFRRWYRESTPPDDRSVADDSTAEIDFALDREAFGVDRIALLNRLAADSRVVRHQDGFGMLRRGHRASYLGPVTASSTESADAIIKQLLRTTGDDVLWDVLDKNEDAVQLANKLGFRPVRELTRMWTGEQLLSPRIDLQFAICDPGTG